MRIALLLLVPAPVLAHDGSGAADAAAAVSLAVAAVVYVWAITRGAPLRARHRAAFAAGWTLLALALLSPLQRAATESFAAHMVQHQLLMIAAPPLIIMGKPFAALAAAVSAPLLRLAALPLRMPPIAAWLLHALALWIWHVPRLFDGALGSQALHAAQHASFFFTALLFWWAVFRRVGSGTAVIYVLTTLIHAGALGALLTFAPAPLYADTPLEAQQLGGLIMWVPAGYTLLLAGLLAFNRLLEAHA